MTTESQSIISEIVLFGTIEQAIDSYGIVPNDNIFSTANFQCALEKNSGIVLASDIIKDILNTCENIVRLSGGAHWMLLPTGVKRYVPEIKKETTTYKIGD